MPKNMIGHNSIGATDMPDDANNGGIAADRLLNIIERLENLDEEKKAIAETIKDLFAEAKSAGFDPKMIRFVLKERAKDDEERQEEEQLRLMYLRAVGLD